MPKKPNSRREPRRGKDKTQVPTGVADTAAAPIVNAESAPVADTAGEPVVNDASAPSCAQPSPSPPELHSEASPFEKRPDPGAVLMNARHEAFAQAVAMGVSDVDAYEKAFGCTRGAAAANATRMRANGNVVARIAHLRERQAARCEMKREELVEMLVRTLRARPSEASLENPLCDLKMSKDGPYAVFTDKLRAAERLCKMLGWDGPEKVEHSGQIEGKVAMLTEQRRKQLAEKKRNSVLRRMTGAQPGAN